MQNEANYRGWPAVTSFRQIEANRRNAARSTGPTTEDGKKRSRCNAVRHGLTAETVISALEDADDYKAFEAAIIADYDAHSAVERELVLRLANLLWRLRRAATMETGLFEIQAEQLHECRQIRHIQWTTSEVGYARARRTDPGSPDHETATHHITNATETAPAQTPVDLIVDSPIDLAQCFLRLANLPNFALDRLSRYEAILSRQVGRILFTLDTLGRRKPHERRRRFPSGSGQEPPAHDEC